MKKNYKHSLQRGLLKNTHIAKIVKIMRARGLDPQKITGKKEYRDMKISGDLARLSLYVIKGSRSWQGLAVGFPGNAEDLTTANVGTPFLRLLLYPIQELFCRINDTHFNGKANCLYLIGARFPDVFIRKFNLLSLLTPRLIVLTNDLIKTVRNGPYNTKRKVTKMEARYQHALCKAMDSNTGRSVPTAEGIRNIKYISYEVQTGEGTKNPEQLDILGFDAKDHSLVAFEIKGPCGDRELKNLFFQGLEHRNWLEKNKMAIKLIHEGLNGDDIRRTRRVRLILGFYDRQKVPQYFYSLKEKVCSKDKKYTKIDFVKLALDSNDQLTIKACTP